MPQRTDIEWSDYTSNPLKLRLRKSGKLVNACVQCSPGCANCYAESITRRYWPKEEGPFPGYKLSLMKMGDVILNNAEVQKLLRFKPKPPFKNGHRPTLFIEDMSDIGGNFVPDELLDQLHAIFAIRHDIDFQVLTKRIERMAEYTATRGDSHCRDDEIAEVCWNWLTDGMLSSVEIGGEHSIAWGRGRTAWSWPLPNVWLGTSVENQDQADKRIPHLLKCPAAVRLLSVEPLLGPIDVFSRCVANRPGCADEGIGQQGMHLHWVIIGCESRGAYPGRFCKPDEYAASARILIDQCREAGVPCFHKQYPVNGKVSGDPSQWPEWARVREFPVTHEVTHA